MVKGAPRKSQQDLVNEALLRGSMGKKGTDSLATISMKGASPALPAKSAENLQMDGRTFKVIDINSIDENPFAPRTIYTDQMLDDMSETLAVNGQQDLIHVCPNPADPTRFIIADGWTRVQSCLKNNTLKTLAAEVHDIPPFAAAWFGYRQNAHRNAMTDYDRAVYCKKVKDAGEDPVIVTGLTKEAVSMLGAYLKLDGEVHDFIKKNIGIFPVSAAYSIHRITQNKGAAQALKIAKIFAEGGKTQHWLRDQAGNKAAQGQLKPEPKPEPLKGQSLIGGTMKKTGDSYSIKMHVQPEAQTAFEQELQQLLKKYGKQ